MKENNFIESLNNFEGHELKILINEDGEPLFELYSIGMVLGYAKWDGKSYFDNGNQKIFPRKDRIEKIVKNAGIIGVCQGGTQYINIDDIRKFISLCHSKNKTNFIEWLKLNNFISYKEVFDTTRKEINFLDKLERTLKPFNITGIRQFPIDINNKHYRIDYYIQNLNIAIEYDENGHKNYSYEEHELRQEEIERELGCKFIRVVDNETNEYNIGLVIKEIFDIKAVA